MAPAMATRNDIQDASRLVAERLVEIFTEAHGRPPVDVEELDAFVKTEVKSRPRPPGPGYV